MLNIFSNDKIVKIKYFIYQMMGLLDYQFPCSKKFSTWLCVRYAALQVNKYPAVVP
jgi:hypothetical protein